MSKGYYVASGDYTGSSNSWTTRETCEVITILGALNVAYKYLLKYEAVRIRKIK